ncbi:hypothetical protein B0H13DRAFT_1907176 [Mycena leptocephala]|nr:hypothetical protein B0H13DRAFT_1907176 [Mycena leptocephala]
MPTATWALVLCCFLMNSPLSAHVVLFPVDSGFSSIMVAPSINLTDFVHPRPHLSMVFFKVTALPDSLSVPDMRDSVPFSLPQSQQQLRAQWDDPAMRQLRPSGSTGNIYTRLLQPSVNAGSTPFHGFELVDLEGKLKLATCWCQHIAALLTPASSEFLAAAATVSQAGSDVAGARRVSARKRAQAELAGATPVSSNKRQKKLEDSLAGWVMQDPNTGKKLTGYKWAKRDPEEFAQGYKKDHQRYLDHFAQ